ncbi:nucleoporin NUP42 isoform X2 [Polyodon spathula]|uniref:nucleoporin NUP42 isoform X2 n=1 Tax=Polyodon spathula TaxID=7913 RepID=UPI001B7E3034|nr:nucleoporin NUP42 isoform X2 [Polyodon spathula]
MTVCGFFLQGRCRFGDKCWNEHPRDASHHQQQPSRGGGGGGGFGNRVWVNPSQRSQNSEYIQPSTFNKQADWGRGRSGRDEGRNSFGGPSGFGNQDGGRKGFSNSGASGFSFSTENRFSALNSQKDFEGGSQGDDIEHLLETIKHDMEIWESSNQWPFSCYSVAKEKPFISGFSDISPEELRLEYYSGVAAGNLQNYANSVQQLANQFKNRLLELKTQNSTTRSSLIAELNSPKQNIPAAGFGTKQASTFGSAGFGASEPTSGSSSSFSFKSSGGFGSAPPGGTTVFGSSPAPQKQPAFGASGTTPSAGFGSSSSTPSAASFSFAAPTAGKEQPSGFGSVQPPGFAAPSGGFGSSSGFGAPSSSSSGFGGSFGFGGPSSASSVSGSSSVPSANVLGSTSTGASSAASGKLFTPQGELTAEELKEFREKRFTLGKIPLKPPPVELLVV